MAERIVKKQENSKYCFVCGLKNEKGVKASFFQTESNELRARFVPCEHHQSYPGRLHGGIAASVLDETMGRAINALHPDGVWGVTVELNVKYRKPVPLDGVIVATGRITKDGGRVFEGSGEILLADGSVAVEATGRYMKLPLEKIADFNADEQEWKVTAAEDDPASI
ncbi:MAG: thioesterase [Treponema sp. GWB1_62_6]|nr:MAG: thioesterase [Treponema sp. GWA1_62_8]OHE62054.1 MAG: thioesterase [Treponema sp. GWB1_62_6]OHE65499.1 MAG: thioesterase [Treponema sp. GWC1_61_84]OHE73789.1 MAG: thioesterase [Treponema sp. RIFOXYC1_FULL_61_9]HCM27700.1 PaaI family thioesterase [Treponema sp.]